MTFNKLRISGIINDMNPKLKATITYLSEISTTSIKISSRHKLYYYLSIYLYVLGFFKKTDLLNSLYMNYITR